MATNDGQVQLLDQLQTEINRVFVQCGQLFKAASSSGKGVVAAHAVRLKRDVPGSISRFHEALDQLEQEIQLAQAVVRRDLARSRQRNAEQISEPIGSVTVQPLPASEQVSEAEESLKDADGVKEDLDVQMKDVDLYEQPKEPSAIPDGETHSELAKPTGETTSLNGSTEPSYPTNEPGDLVKQEETPVKHAATGDSKPTPDNLELITNIPSKPEPEDQPPDTAITSDTRDLESLFGPQSAGPGAAADDFQPNGDNAGEAFDFGSFDASAGHGQLENADESINSLLPGLQDYANNRPNPTDADLDALFGTDADAAPGAEDSQGDNQNFDDFMDFSSFNADDLGPAGGGEGSQDYMQELNFD